MTRIASLLLSLIVATTLSAQDPVEASASIQNLVKTAQAASNAGQWAKAADAWREVTEAAPKDGRGWHMLGYSLHAMGRLDEALDVHVKAAEFPGTGATAAYNAACVYALKGNKDAAFEWLEKAAAKGFGGATHVAGDSDMDALRDDPRFQTVVAKIRENETGGANVQAFGGGAARGGHRLLFWSGNASVGQIHVGYGVVPWNDAMNEKLATGAFLGKRWRLGRDFWTTLDTNLPLVVGDQKVAPGLYYLTLKQTGEREAVLELHDPAVARKMRLDAFQPDRLPAGIPMAMEWKTGEDAADRLEISVHGDDGELGKGHLEIRFGPHALRCAFAAELDA